MKIGICYIQFLILFDGVLMKSILLQRVEKSLNTRTIATPEQKQNREDKKQALNNKADAKELTRKKIIVGGTILKAIEEDHVLKMKLQQLLQDHIFRQSDFDIVADLIGLDELPEQHKKPQ